MPVYVTAPIRVPAPATGQVSGTVVDALTGKPIAGAVVAAEGPTAANWTLSGPNGRFSIARLPSNLYDVYVRAGGYRPREMPWVPVFNGATQQLGAVELSRSVGRVVATVTPSVVEIHAPAAAGEASSTALRTIPGRNFNADEDQLLCSLPHIVCTSTGKPLVAGYAPQAVRYEYDGVPFSTPSTGQNGSYGLDAGVQTIQVGH